MKEAHKKIREGLVVSDKMDKTIIVSIERKITHPLYQKTLRRNKKFKVHDEENKCKVGDFVSIIETRPLSKDKRWRVLEIIGAAKGKIEEEDKGRPALVRGKKEEELEASAGEGERI